MLFFGWLIWDTFLIPRFDYSKLYVQLPLVVAPPLFMFLSGAFLGASLIWMTPLRTHDCSPIRVAFSSVLGALVGIVIACVGVGIYVLINPLVIDKFTEQLDTSQQTILNHRTLAYYWFLLIFIFSLIAARIGAGSVREKPAFFLKRFSKTCVFLLIFLIPLVCVFTFSDFPGQDVFFGAKKSVG